MNNVFVLLSVSHLYSLSFQNPQYPILFNNKNDYLGESDGGFDIQNSPPNQNRMSPSFQNSINQNIPDSMSFSDQNRLVNPSYQNYQNRMNPSMNPAFQDSWSLADQNGRANPAIDYAQNELSPPINPPPINPISKNNQNWMSPPITPILPNRVLPKNEINAEGFNSNSGTMSSR